MQIPPSAALLSEIWLDIRWQWVDYLGAVLIILTVFLLALDRQRKPIAL
ncbi:hypothetical protein [Spirosoma validum]|uniref:Uncharacterized protein n=1 Tax=Spirosoma validum TaxID=2771355 RepID=A0A927GEW9_9BACT|nr:hypothetical protein [Spirosoma validum]MBD2755257.1 hypothetical protein [Spirosoma validum]